MENNEEGEELSREIQGALREARLNCDILELILDRYLRNSILPQPRDMGSTSNGFLAENDESPTGEDGGGFQEMQMIENGGNEDANYLMPPSPELGRRNALENRRQSGSRWHIYFSGFLMALLLFAVLFTVLFFRRSAEKVLK